MNFGSGGSAGGGGGGGSENVVAGQELAMIDTEELGFHSVSGEDKLQLLSAAWPTNQLPPPTASLLSIASSKGLVAAAGPEKLVIASTESVRQTFNDELANDNVKAFTPQATLPIPRVSQVMFSSDESCLVIAAEQGGGLAVYDTNALTNGGREPAFQLATEGQSVRQLLPNPNPSPELSRYFGIVTENGHLLLADLQSQKLVPNTSGSPIFHENVSCACWSRLGKQIVAGLADGSALQIDQQGVVKASIPQPPQLAGSQNPVTTIYWLETYDFLMIHTPVLSSRDAGDGASTYHLAHRDKTTSTWTFSAFQDPCLPYGMERKPAQHFVARLRDWLDLTDLLILASTASADIGLFTRSRKPLDPATPVADAYTSTQPPDGRRALMPMGADGGDTSPIGVALDLSVKEKVERPIPGDDMLDESPVPLPALYVLDNEGMVRMWYFVYNDAVRRGEAYPDLVAAGGPRPLGVGEQKAPQQPAATMPAATSSSFAASANTTASPFGQAQKPQTSVFGAPSQPASTFGQPQQPQTSTFGAPSQPASTFGQPQQPQTSTFGQPSTPAFGASSSMGNKASPWAGSPTAGGPKPTFGQITFGQSSFGQAGGGMGANKGSVWGTPQQQPQSSSGGGGTFGSGSTGGSLFGGGNAAPVSPFMNLGGAGSTGGVFGSAAKPSPSPFASAAASSTPRFGQPNIGGEAKQTSPFASANTSAPRFGQPSFGSSGQNNQSQPLQPSPFASTKPTLSAEPSGSTISFGSGGSFGSGSTTFGVTSLNSQTESREESMEDEAGSETSTLKAPSQPPAASEGTGGLFGAPGGGFKGFKLGSTFKSDGSAKDDLPRPKEPGAGLFGKGFGDALGLGESSSTAPATVVAPEKKDESGTGSEAAWMSGRSTPVVKKEPGTDEPKLGDIPPAPAPATTKASEPVDDAPLPPDPTTWKPKPGALPPPIPPGFGADFATPAASKGKEREAPPSISGSSAGEERRRGEESVLAGSPPVDLGGEKFSEAVASPSASREGDEEAAGPPESDDDEGEWSDEDEDAEGEEEEVDDEGDDDVDEDVENRTPQVIDAKGLSAFEARLTPASPKRGEQQPSTTPATEQKVQDSYTPAGMPQAPIMFPPPQRREQESPRSPSPVRSATSPVRSMPLSFGQSLQASTGGKNALPSATTAQQIPSSASRAEQPAPPPPQRVAVTPAELVQSQKQKEKAPASAEPEEGSLEDEEDARIQAILAAPIDPSREVPDFLAHQDLISSTPRANEKGGLGGQIERVFRDINSMLDTLALNARALQGFVEGNFTVPAEQQQKTRLDLEEENAWLLSSAPDLEAILSGIAVELEDGRLEDVHGALLTLREHDNNLGRLRTRLGDTRKFLASRSDPHQLALQHSAPLPLESASQQAELRQGVQRVQALLGKAEEGLSVLRAEMASLPQQGAAVPTAEAVLRTIEKMTAMAQQKSGDVDVLEAAIRRLGGSGALALQGEYENELVRGLKKSRLRDSEGSPRTSRFGSPGAGKMRASRFAAAAEGTPEGFAGGSSTRSLFDVSEVEVEAYRVRKEGRRRKVVVLRELVEGKGVRVVKASG